MQKHSLFIFVFVVSVLYISVNSDGADIKRYPDVKSGIIKYDVSGMSVGTEVVYFDDWGRREAKYTNTTTTIMGVSQKTNTLTIMLDSGKWIYSIDLDQRTGTKMKSPMFDSFAAKPDEELIKFAEEMMKAMGGEKTGTEKVLGKVCEVWEVKIANSRTCIWNGIPLKTEAGIGTMRMSITATEIETGVSIPGEKFEIPSDVEMQTIDMSNIQGY